MGEDRSSEITAGKVQDAGALTGRTRKSPEPQWAVWFLVLFPNSKVVSTFLGPSIGLPPRTLSTEPGWPLSIRAGHARLEGLISKTGEKCLVCWRPRLRPRRNRSHYGAGKRLSGMPAFGDTVSQGAFFFLQPLPRCRV